MVPLRRPFFLKRSVFVIRTWCKDHPIQFMACYLVFYLAFFKLLEQGIQVPDLVLHCRLDDLISFCKYAIIPYYLWFAWIPCTLFYLLWFNDRRDSGGCACHCLPA